MKTLMYFLVAALSISFALIDSAAQVTETDSVAVKEIVVFVKEKGKSVGYKFRDSRNDVIFIGDSMKVQPRKYKFNVSVSDVNMLRLESGNMFKESAMIGGGLGFLIGFLMGSSYSVTGSGGAGFGGGIVGGLIVALPFAGLFGGLGALVAGEKDFEIPDYPLAQKRAMILKILRDNRAK